jgi:hypothetical protein
MAMARKVSATLDPGSKAEFESIMRRTRWTKSQVIREAIWAVAKNRGLARRSAKRIKG